MRVSFSIGTRPMATSSTTATGTSKATPNENSSTSTNSMYTEMSAISCTPCGVVLTKKPKISGITR